MKLFAYGSLMCPDILAEVAGAAARAEKAELPGYGRWRVKGEDYPAVRPLAGGRVPGILYAGLPASAWTRLDRFEGDMYRRESLRVRRGDGTRVSAEVYVLRDGYAHCLDSEAWDYREFLRRGKKRFQSRYLGWDALDADA
jgi:gamma-glutamylcyclotransferase (GGCT)/AIG2-like uncharacterized protein YtfP